MPAHREEILAKRAKLEEIRRQRELRQKDNNAFRQSLGASPGRQGGASPSGRAESKQEVDDLVARLVGDGQTPSTPGSHGSPPSRDKSRPSSYVSPGAQDSVPSDGPNSPPSAQYNTLATQTLEFSALRTLYEIKSAPPIHEILTYSKGVQTSGQLTDNSRSTSDTESDSVVTGQENERSRRQSQRQREREEELRQNIRKEIEEELKAIQQPQANGHLASPQQQKYPARALTDEELNAVTSSNDFFDFVERSSKVIERALDEEYDLLADYQAHNLTGLEDDDDDVGGNVRKGRRVKEVMQFFDDRWSKRRMVSDIAFSPKYPELLLSAHTKNPSAPYEPSGLVQVWNQHMHSRPEYVFHATSDVLTAKFSPFHPNLILGGSYSGQVLLWDTRSRSTAPVQKTPLTGTGFGHTHPIYSVNIIGTQNAHNVISTSTDGVVCSWSIDMLSQPQEHLELARPSSSISAATSISATIRGPGPSNRPDDLAPTCVAFPSSDPTYFLSGTEEGPIYLCHRYDRAGAKAGVDPHMIYSGHMAPVMSLDFHSSIGPADLGDLVLSTGLDWCVRLWRIRTPSAARIESSAGGTATNGGSGAGSGGTRDIAPLLEIQRDDAVYDAKWSPSRPGVFAMVDGAGYLEIWDLSVETEVPVAKVTPSQFNRSDQNGAALAGLAGRQQRSLNKCAWEAGEGRRLACAGLDGVVTVFEVGSELGGTESARAEEWTRMKRLVGRLEAI